MTKDLAIRILSGDVLGTTEQTQKAIAMAVQSLEEAPTVDVPDRKVGKWECSDDIFEYALCSCCKWDSGEAWEYALKRFRFCPNCGARMKGEDDG